MLVRLLPEQITNFWEIIKESIELSLPPVVGDNADRMKNIMVSLLSGTMDCWASFTLEDGNTNINGIVVTTIIEDTNSGTKDLLIYSVYGITSITKDSWADGQVVLAKWGKENGCSRITGYTDVESIITAVKRLGGNAEQVYITLPIN